MIPVTRAALLGVAAAVLLVISPAGSPQLVADGVPLPPPTGLVDSNIWG